MEWIQAEAPSNIALIKYMGKVKDAASGNTSTNASLSYTLDHLRTRVRVRWEDLNVASNENASGETRTPFQWRPLVADGFHAPVLSSEGQERFLRHAERCLNRLGGSEFRSGLRTLVVESANGFPSDCGLASSASSFAALTLAMAKLLGRNIENFETRRVLAELSREGSGSSCRSLFSPWVIWKSTGAEPVSGFPSSDQIRHLVLIVDDQKKEVSSSEAHVRVTSSLLFRGRVDRAEERLRLLVDNMNRASGEGGISAWNRAAHLVWAESWDMHALFESSEPPFGYFVPGSVEALNLLREITQEMKSDSGTFREPMVTMDAGPNVHVLLWKDGSTDAFVRALKSRLSRGIRVLDSDEMSRS